MPELPDVEGFRSRFEKRGLLRTIEGFHAHEQKLLDDATSQGIGRRMKGEAFTAIERYGKYLLARVEGSGWLVLHFGMTGDLAFYGDEEQPPAHEAVRIDFRDGGHLAYTSQRRLGKLAWVARVDDLMQRERLGPDALSEDLPADRFMAQYSGHRGMLKTALMNQALVAGIGNVYADEILFQSKLPPKTSLANLGPKQLRDVYRVMRRVLRTAAAAHAEERPLRSSYLVAHRAPKEQCPRCHAHLRTMKVSGRTSYYCPRCQHA